MQLPGIKQLVNMYKMHKLIQSSDYWDLYVALKEKENNSKIGRFEAQLILLQVCVEAKEYNKEKFEKTKNDLLSNPIINEPRFGELKEWLNNIDSESPSFNEKDSSRIQELIKLL